MVSVNTKTRTGTNIKLNRVNLWLSPWIEIDRNTENAGKCDRNTTEMLENTIEIQQKK